MHQLPWFAHAVRSLHDAAAQLLQVGVPCKVLERDPGPRKGGSAIGLWPNAFRALDALGVADSLRQKHPLISRQVSLSCQHSNIWQHSMKICVASRLYMGALDRFFGRNKTCPACNQKALNLNKSGNLANSNSIACHPCRVELCTDDGNTLKAFSLDECQGAPHEFRGVKRSTLLEALQSIVPESCIEYNAAIHSVETDQNGKVWSTAAATCFLSACLMRTIEMQAWLHV